MNDNGRLLQEVKDILATGEVPQRVSNRLVMAMQIELHEHISRNTRVIHGTEEREWRDGMKYRVAELERNERTRKEEIEEKRDTYWKPFIGGLAGGVSSLILAWVIGLL